MQYLGASGHRTFPRSAVFFGCLCAAAAVCLCSNPIPANDLFWQLRAGRDIALTHHAPVVDRYSWTEKGTPWVAPEWLSFFLFWEAYRTGGYGGVWLLTAALSAAIGIRLWLCIRRQFDSDLPAFLLTGITLYGIGPFLQPRPQIWSYLGFVIGLPILQAGLVAGNRAGSAPHYTSPARTPRRLWLLVPLCLVWANLHQGALLFVGLLVVVSLISSAAALSLRRRHPEPGPSSEDDGLDVGRLWIVTTACALATIATPYGWKIYEVTFATIGSGQAMADSIEWWPLATFGPRDVVPVVVLGLIAAVCYYIAYCLGAAETPTAEDAMARRASIVLGVSTLVPLLEQAIVHGRQAPFFLLTAGIIAAPAAAGAIRKMRHALNARAAKATEAVTLGAEGICSDIPISGEEDGSEAGSFGALETPTCDVPTDGITEARMHPDDTESEMEVTPLPQPFSPAGKEEPEESEPTPIPPIKGSDSRSTTLPVILTVGVVVIAVAGLMLPTLMALALAQPNAPRTLTGVGRVVFEVNTFPASACRFIRSEGLPSSMRMFNSYDIGGYLIWALPEHPVFIDGRQDLYLKRELADSDKIADAWSMDDCRDVVDRYGFDLVVTDGGRDTRPFAVDPNWATVYRDLRILDGRPVYNSYIFIRRRPEYAALISRCQSDFAAHPPELQ